MNSQGYREPMTNCLSKLSVAFFWAFYACSIATAQDLPDRVVDLSHWKLTLPKSESSSKGPREVEWPELEKFTDPDCFLVTPEQGILLRAACNGATTKGSKYPRCELREMSERPDREAAWSTSGKQRHSLTAQLAITHTPSVKPHVVCAQIHDAKDDVLMIRLEGTKLFIERNRADDVLLMKGYKLGERFDLKIEAADGQIEVWLNGQSKMRWKVDRSGCYFKIGTYTQSNLDKGDSASDYGEVILYQLKVEHHP